jgi:hypothetical protein
LADAVASTILNALIVFGTTFFFTWLPVLATFDAIARGNEEWWQSGLISLALIVPIFLLLALWRRRSLRAQWLARGGWSHRWRMNQVARDSGLQYFPTHPMPIGTVLAGAGGDAWDVFARPGDPTAWFGNARSRTRAAKNHAENGWHFLAVTLPTSVPHLMLIPRKRGIHLVAPMLTYGREQRLSLEGDFDRHFQLYAPAEYGRDALYVITPDLMALLIDNLPGSYVEAFDQTLVITTPKPANFARPETWDRIDRLLRTVVPKAMRQTRAYVDSRSAVRGTVAGAGRRLRYGISIASVIGLVFLIAQIVRLIMLANQ